MAKKWMRRDIVSSIFASILRTLPSESDGIRFDPVSDLKEISQHLRAGHELAVPRFSVIARRREEMFQLLFVKNASQRGICLINHLAEAVSQKSLVSRVVRFGIRAFFPVQNRIR